MKKEFHMPKKTPEITDNLDEFVDKLLNQIADESEEGRKALVKTMSDAKGLYKKPMDSWLTGWVYRYTRIRGPEIDRAIGSVQAFPDAYTRLQDLKILVAKKGEWHTDSSYNYYLFLELIKSVPGYKPLDEGFTPTIIIKIKDKIIDQIDIFMRQYQANQESIAHRNKEREVLRRSTQKPVDGVLIFDSLEKAQLSIQGNPSKIHFCLTLVNKTWHLSWIDLTKKVYKLDLSNELIHLLVNQQAKNEEPLNLIHLPQLKKECMNARELFLDKVQLYINPKDPVMQMSLNNEDLIAQGIIASFVLRGKSEHYSLYWINTLGHVTEIYLASYPQFKSWLDTQSSLKDEVLLQLKAYLLNVNTSKVLTVMDNFKKELEQCVLKGCHSVMSVQTVPQPLKMDFFSNVVKCVEKQHAKKPEKYSHSLFAQGRIEQDDAFDANKYVSS